MIFEDRYHAGILLSQSNKLQKYKQRKSTLVLGIPRGGVVVAKAVSNQLNIPLSAVVTKKIGAPYQDELAIGAIGPEGTVVLDNKLISDLEVTKEYLEEKAKEKTDEIAGRIIMYFGAKEIKLPGQIVILVDDGIATGATVEVAIKYLRQKKVKKIILAVPVSPKSAFLKFGKLVNELIILHSPLSFKAVGQFYKHFPQISDEEVVKLLKAD